MILIECTAMLQPKEIGYWTKRIQNSMHKDAVIILPKYMKVAYSDNNDDTVQVIREEINKNEIGSARDNNEDDQL